MSIFDRRPRLRWAVPAAAAALILGGVVLGTAGVSAESGLPPKSAEQLLVELQAPQAAALSGTVEASADLGLPELPMDVATGAGPQALLTGSNTLRVWIDGAERSRVALLGGADEYDVIRNGEDGWVWSSTAQTAEHFSVPKHDGSQALGTPVASTNLPSTPQEAAAMALQALDGSTAVTTSGVAQVAGRPVYELILTPKQSDTLVARVVIGIDAETHVPLRVQVFSTQLTDPAFEVGFTSVDFGVPDAGLFEFTPPPGATVSEHQGDASAGVSHPANGEATMDEPTIVGTGWSRVILATPPKSGGEGAKDASAPDTDALGLLEALPRTSGDWGTGKVLSGTLVSAILTDDGRVALGAVTPETLGAALAAR